MSKVVFLDPIDHVSGKLSKKSRVTYCYKAENDRKYTQIRGKRTTPYTADEMARFDKGEEHRQRHEDAEPAASSADRVRRSVHLPQAA